MASQFYGLNIAYTGLLASNAALNTTSNNISNIETKGYSKQVVNQTAADALRTYTTFGCSGSGVDVDSIERLRDEFYDVKYWNNNEIKGEYDKKNYYTSQIQQYFIDDDTVKGFKSIFDEMFNSMQELMKSSGDSVVKAQFIGYANNLTTYFNEMASNLSKVQEDINSEVKVKVDEINSLAEEIASLNKQINVIELTGVTANELRDQRTVLIDQLSAVVDVEVTETPIYDTYNPDRFTGAHRYMVTIADGQVLVDGSDYNGLECRARETTNKSYQSDVQGMYDIYWSNGATFGMYSASMGGELAGLIHMRDGNNGEYFYGEFTDLKKDAQGNALATIKVSADYLLDMTKCTLPDSGTINIGNTLYKYSEWSFDETTGSYTFKINKDENDSEVPYSKLHREASVNQAVNYKGIPYYQEQLNEWVRLFAKAFNGILTQEGSSDIYGDPGRNLFTGNLATAKQLTFRHEGGINGEITSSSDCYRMLTAANFGINEDLLENADRLATHTDASAGQDKYDILEELYSMKSDANVMTFRGGTAEELLEWILGDVALNAERAETFYNNADVMASKVDNQRTSISGVDNDEEAVSLVKYQNAYNLSSKMIQVLTEIYDRLILETGV
ncbi:MAG: flagellar hook-associated protein FlgK [Lachnospiraceae bacterium]|nr:flagellar hook-associated protein FlgK [Lachnospiraceae bacterium]